MTEEKIKEQKERLTRDLMRTIKRMRKQGYTMQTLVSQFGQLAITTLYKDILVKPGIPEAAAEISST